MALTKADLIHAIYTEFKVLTKQESKEFVDLMFEEMINSLAAGVEVRLSGFGSFEVRAKKPRPGRNPKTGVAVEIPAQRTVAFKQGYRLKVDMTEHEDDTELLTVE